MKECPYTRAVWLQHRAGRATVEECPFTRGVWPPPRGQGGHLRGGYLPPVLGLNPGGQEGLAAMIQRDFKGFKTNVPLGSALGLGLSFN